ncbi:MAG: DeoR family transcriptional regulator [Patescibacteria group bacterium]
MESDKNTSLSTHSKSPEIISFFEKDGDFIFVYKKTEKLATAVYMITNLFADNEPMKWTLREKVNQLLSHTIKYKDVFASERTDFVFNVKTRVLEIISFLEISSRTGLISEMNFSILKQEFSNLISVLDTSRTEADGYRNILSKNFFDVPRSNSLPREDARNSDHGSHSTSVPTHTQTIAHQPDMSVINNRMAFPNTIVFKKNNRQNIILQLLKRKKDLTIKDIAENIRDCSEKTIQRELIALINLGVLKKTGERRWSKYSLATSSE